MVFRVYCIQFIVQNYTDDPEELSEAVQWLAYAAGVDFIFNIFMGITKWNRYRKCSITVGLLLFGLVVGGFGYLQFKNNWDYKLYMPMAAYPIINVLVISPFLSYVQEIFTRRFRTLPISNMLFFGTISCIIFPLLEPRQNNNAELHYYSWFIGGGSILAALIFLIVAFETRGLTKEQIYMKFEGKINW